MTQDDKFRVKSAKNIFADGDVIEVEVSKIINGEENSSEKYRTAWDRDLSFISDNFCASERISIEDGNFESTKFIQANLSPINKFTYKLFDRNIAIKKFIMTVMQEKNSQKERCSVYFYTDYDDGQAYAIMHAYIYLNQKPFDVLFSRAYSKLIDEMTLSLREASGFYMHNKKDEIKILTRGEYDRIENTLNISLDNIVAGCVKRASLCVNSAQSSKISLPNVHQKTNLRQILKFSKNVFDSLLFWFVLGMAIYFIYTEFEISANFLDFLIFNE